MFLTSASIKLLCASDLYPVPFLIWTLLSKRALKVPGETHGWEPHRRGSSGPILREDYPPTSSNCSISNKKAVTNQQCHSSSCQFPFPATHATGIKGKGYSPMERRKRKENLLELPESNFTWDSLKDLVNIMQKMGSSDNWDTLRGSPITRKVISQEEIHWAVWSLGQPQSTHKGDTGRSELFWMSSCQFCWQS